MPCISATGKSWAPPESASGAPITGVYQRLSNPYVDAETHKLRAFLYEGGLLPKAPVTARALLRAAKEGGYPAFLADLRDDRGATVPFFGHPARSNTFPALLARTVGLPLYAGAAFRQKDVRFVIRIEPVPVPVTKDRAADAVVATAALQKQFEAFIREAAGAVDVGSPEMGLTSGQRASRAKAAIRIEAPVSGSTGLSCANSIP